MNRLPNLAAFLGMAFALMSAGFPIEIMSNCSAHGIRPQSSTVFCHRCGALHSDETELCACGSSKLLAMCDLCDLHFRQLGRVPVERAN